MNGDWRQEQQPNPYPAGHFVCNDQEEELPDSDIMFASWISVLTSLISLACLGLVLSSQMKWWLSSPFLSRVRWHVLLDTVNVWLFHFLATHPSCGLDYHAASGMTTLSVQAVRILTLFHNILVLDISNAVRVQPNSLVT